MSFVVGCLKYYCIMHSLKFSLSVKPQSFEVSVNHCITLPPMFLLFVILRSTSLTVRPQSLPITSLQTHPLLLRKVSFRPSTHSCSCSSGFVVFTSSITSISLLGGVSDLTSISLCSVTGSGSLMITLLRVNGASRFTHSR